MNKNLILVNNIKFYGKKGAPRKPMEQKAAG